MSQTVKAQASYAISVIPGMGSVSHWLECSMGDFYQRCQKGDGTSAPTSISPDFAVTKPVISFRTADHNGNPIPADSLSVTWSFMGQTISLDGNGVSKKLASDTIDFTGVFKVFEGDPDATDELERYPRIMILQNLAGLTGGLNAVLKGVCLVTPDNGAASSMMTCIIPYSCLRVQGNDRAVHIVGEPGMVINHPIVAQHSLSANRVAKLTLKTEYYLGTESKTPHHVKWEKMGSGGTFQEITDSSKLSGNDLLVEADDVDGSAVFRATAYADQADAVGVCDTAVVRDVSDPIQIIPNPTPDIGAVYCSDHADYNASTNGQVLFQPFLSTSDETADKINNISPTFAFSVINEQGASIGIPAGRATSTQFTFIADDYRGSGERNLLVVISSTVNI